MRHPWWKTGNKKAPPVSAITERALEKLINYSIAQKKGRNQYGNSNSNGN